MSQNSLIGGHHRIAYLSHQICSMQTLSYDRQTIVYIKQSGQFIRSILTQQISGDNKIDELWLSYLERIRLISSAKKTTNNLLGHFVNSINKTSYVFCKDSTFPRQDLARLNLNDKNQGGHKSPELRVVRSYSLSQGP